ncbi:hypothetical protein WH95_19570 [Kiloniella litopenaei]|uniref:Bacterial virulence protein VirB8 domain-containing protein n=1 Tax=Kiloniella litopenaei TaxID=1549748 RepID=A0A0M2R5G8_9PROT|nr:hypothetical protein [Kiloniella litopenaei]KKJ75220.1 hypothetical protein WH95_19570 [Kiloniella litopenaei]
MSTEDNVYVNHAVQAELKKSRSQTELVRAQVSNRWLTVVAVLSLLIAVFSMYFAYVSNERFANNVRIAWVKLAPDGSHTMEFLEDGGASNRWFDATVTTSLMNFTEARFSKKRATIEGDFGFAQYYYSPQMLTQFMTDFNAPQVAAELLDCHACNEVEIKVRALDHSDYIAPTDKSETVYRSTMYVTETIRTPSGGLVSRENKLIHITWKQFDISEVTSNPEMLRANPVGVQILDHSVRKDLTNAGGQS